MSYSLEIKIPNMAEVAKRFNDMPAEVVRLIDEAIGKGSLYIEGLAKREVGAGHGGWDTGRLASSIRTELGVLSATVAPHVSYAIYVHQGTRPHWAPISALAPWAERHGINPYAVQASIARKGTKGNPFMERAAEGAESGVMKIFKDVIDKVKGL